MRAPERTSCSRNNVVVMKMLIVIDNLTHKWKLLQVGQNF